MPQEFFDIVDENNIPTGETKSRDLVHREKKDWHRAVHIWIINNRGEILCQQRSWKKDGNPGKWQSFFGGHVKSGQTIDDCLKEELLEEVGIDITKTKKQPVFLNIRRWEVAKHFGYTYFLEWDGTIENVIFNDGEVEQVIWMDIVSLQAKIDEGDFCNIITDSVREYLKSNSFLNA